MGARLTILTPPPIPFWEERSGWQKVPIVECGEALIPVPTGGDTNIVARADYSDAGMPGALPTIYVREGAADRLIHAAASLKSVGLTLVIFDGYRPLSVQRHLFDSCAATIRSQQPELTDAEVVEQVRRFVAFPSSDPLCPPPHLTGGALDVYLISGSGVQLPMGTDPDAVEEASATRFYEDSPEEPFLLNRRLLYSVMAGAGFTNYHEEWWHYDYGNQRWANIASESTAAIYGVPTAPD